jgi:tetratricopeptide (TPR) repeat protein
LALAHLETAQEIDPARTALDGERAALLEAQHRFCEARAVYETMLAREPGDARLHEAYNDLLYRLGSDEEFLTSYDGAPASPELLLQKCRFLLAAERGAEAEILYGGMLSRDLDNREAALGHGLALLQQGASDDAVLALERAALRHPQAADIWCNLSGALMRSGDVQKAEAMANRCLQLEPYNQIGIATLGTCWRLLEDGRDEWLNRYEDFVQVFDLEPPEGFANMEQFNAALNASLDRLHPPVREYLRQSLRGGTQTSANLFGSDHLLVDKLRTRIEDAVARYLDDLELQHDHPFLTRKAEGFAFGGSWSSRLRNQGFHVNHVHPGGWISSCYYVDLPAAVADGNGKQGWIKFGEPSFDTGLAPVRTIQPSAGRLILFPSYLWHGTIAFHDRNPRTTIAFDLVPR